MPTTFTAQPGDSLCSIAHLHGFGDCTALRSEAANAFILNRAVDPAVPLPGDVVTIPDQVNKQEEGGTDQKHKFVKKIRSATIRFVHGSPDKPYADDTTLTELNVSNYITNRGGTADGSTAFPGDGVRRFDTRGHQDPDTFKVEVQDIRASGNLTVELEALRPTYNAAGAVTGHTSFPGNDRKLTATASKQGQSRCFRTAYLRLVVDDQDKAAAPTQTLLVSDMNDAGDPQVEILDQLVKATYEVQSCPASPKCKCIVTAPIGTDRRRLRVAVHVLNNPANGNPIVPLADAERRVRTWVRRVYAQASIGPKLANPTHAIDAPENLVSISNDSGLTAAGDGQLSFRINATGQTPQTITVNPSAGDTPITTANALAGQITAPFSAAVTQNPARFNDPVGQGSADLVITEAGGAKVTIDNVVSGDSRQTLTVGRPNPMVMQEWDGNNFLVGSIEQRTVLKNFDTGDDRVDIFVVDVFVDGTLGGAAMMSGHRLDPNRSAINQVKWSVFIIRTMMDSTDNHPFALPHEIGHDTAEVVHTANAENFQLMNGGFLGSPNAVNLRKRIRDGAATYTSPAGNFNLVDRLRVEGAPLLENW